MPTLTGADLRLARGGYLEQYLLSVEPGHSYHLVNIWLYDEPKMLNDAVAGGLTDDQWGMVKERGFAVGPWFLTLPAIVHVKLPNGATGGGFLLDNLLVALFFLLAVPLVPRLRDLPKRLKLYRLIYRYPTRLSLNVDCLGLGLPAGRLDFDPAGLGRFGDRDGEGEDALVVARLDPLEVQVLAEEQLTGEGTLRPLSHQRLVLLALLEEPLRAHGEGVLRLSDAFDELALVI